FYGYVHLLYSHSFPTRRSSDLIRMRIASQLLDLFPAVKNLHPSVGGREMYRARRTAADVLRVDQHAVLPQQILRGQRIAPANLRSEEHTSELQSQSNLVCRLLL